MRRAWRRAKGRPRDISAETRLRATMTDSRKPYVRASCRSVDECRWKLSGANPLDQGAALSRCERSDGSPFGDTH
jgi:hypothetical protein